MVATIFCEKASGIPTRNAECKAHLVAAVANGKQIIYVKLGSTFYMLNSEKSSQATLTNVRKKADDTYVEAEELDIYVDSSMAQCSIGVVRR